MNVEDVTGAGRAGPDVLARAQAGDERAFLALYRAAHPGLVRYLSVIAPDAAEQVAAQAWADVIRELAGFGGSLDEFRVWLAGVGRRKAMEHLERDRGGRRDQPPRSRTAPARGSAQPPPTNRPARTAATAGTESALRMIADLPQNEAEALLLRCVMGIDDDAAASVVGMPRSTLRRAALRGLRGLSRRLEAAAGRHGGLDADASEVLQEPASRVLRVVPDPTPAIVLSDTGESFGFPRAPGSAGRGGGERTASWPAQPLPRVVQHDVADSRGLEVSQ